MEVENEGIEEPSRLLQDEEKLLIVIAHKYFGLSQGQIVSQFDFQQSTVSRILKCIKMYRENDGVDNDYSNCGRKKLEEHHPLIPELINQEMEDNTEYIWNIMKQKFKILLFNQKFKTKEEITNCLYSLWDSIKQEEIDACIDKVLQNMETVLLNYGELIL